jgi:hypothetical protein
MLLGIFILFVCVVYMLGHATRRWMRTSRRTTQEQVSAGLLESDLVSSEEREKLRMRLRDKLKQQG